MEVIKLRNEYIKLGQVLKAMNLVESGADVFVVSIVQPCVMNKSTYLMELLELKELKHVMCSK